MKNYVILFFTALLWLASSLEVAAFRCGNDLISEGDLMIQVRESCGEPAAVQNWEEVRLVRVFRFGFFYDSLEKIPVEEWIYNLGPARFIRIIRFEKGEVAEIRTGDYGF